MTVVLDAFALIALLRGEPAADEVEALLRRGDAVMGVVNLAEALDILMRNDGLDPERLEAASGRLVRDVIELLPVDERIARNAADLRARRYHRSRMPLSMADCLLLAAAVGLDATIATADRALAASARGEGVDVVTLPDKRGRRPR